jgi:hypothetical protein
MKQKLKILAEAEKYVSWIKKKRENIDLKNQALLCFEGKRTFSC